MFYTPIMSYHLAVMPYTIQFNKDNSKHSKYEAVIFSNYTCIHIHAYWQVTCSFFSRLNSWWSKPLTQTHSKPKKNDDNDQSKLKVFTLQIYEHQHLCYTRTHASMCTNTHTYSQALWLQRVRVALYTKKVSLQLSWVNKYMIIKQ